MEHSFWTLIDNSDSVELSVWEEFQETYPLNLFPTNEEKCYFTTKDGFYVSSNRERGQRILNEHIISVCQKNRTIYLCSQEGVFICSIDDDSISSISSPFYGYRIVQVACGTSHVLFRTNVGELFVEGSGPQTGLGRHSVNEPTKLKVDHVVHFIAAGGEHSLAVVTTKSNRQRLSGMRVCNRSSCILTSDVLETKMTIPSTWGANLLDRLLETKRFGAPHVWGPWSGKEDNEVFEDISQLSEINTAVMIWGKGNDYRLGFGNELDHSLPTDLLLLSGRGIVAGACGARHSAAVSASGELFIWGSPFPGKHFKTPQIVNCDSDRRVLNVQAGDYFTLATVCKADGNLSLSRILLEEDDLILRDILPKEEVLLQASETVDDKCFAVFREGSNLSEVKVVHKLCFEWCRRLQFLLPIPDSPSDVVDVKTFEKGFCGLISKLNILCQTTVVLMRYLALHTLRLPTFELIEEKLLTLLKTHIEAQDNFWRVALNFDNFNGFELLMPQDAKTKKSLDNRFFSDTGILKREMLMDYPAMLKETKSIVLALEYMTGDKQPLNQVMKKIDAIETKLSKLSAKKNMMSEPMRNLPKSIVEQLYGVDSDYHLINTALFKSQPSKSSNPFAVPIRVHGPPNFKKYDDAQVCLGSKQLIIVRKVGVNEFKMSAWPLKAVWIEESQSASRGHFLKIRLPEMALTLTAESPKEAKLWKEALIDAINGTFDTSNARLASASNWDRRKMKYSFRFGDLANCTYEGEWFKGEMDGCGELTGPTKVDNGQFKYIGEFRANKRDGLGTNFRSLSDSSRVEIRSGFWKNDELNGFGIIEHEKSVSSSGHGSVLISSEPCYIGNFALGCRTGYGIADEKDGKYIGRWENNKKHGPGVIVTLKGRPAGSIVRCEFHKDKIKSVTGNVHDFNFRYDGHLDANLQPKGEGVFFCRIETGFDLKIDGVVTLSDDLDKKILVKYATITLEPASAQDIVFMDEKAADNTHWASLVELCSHALYPVGEDLYNTTIWKKTLRRLLCKDDSQTTWSRQDIKHFGSLRLTDKQKMIDVMQYLIKLPTSPIAVFFEVLLKELTFAIGLQIQDVSCLQEMMLQQLKCILHDLYSLACLLFPALPKDMNEEVTLENSDETFSGVDFAYRCLPDDSKVFSVMSAILVQSCSEKDDAFIRKCDNQTQALDRQLIVELCICNSKIRETLVQLVEEYDSHVRNPFSECVEILRCCFQNVVLNYSSALRLFQQLMHFQTVLSNASCVVSGQQIGADDFLPLLSFLIWKAQPKKLFFCLSFLEKVTHHSMSGDQDYLLSSFVMAYEIINSIIRDEAPGR